MKVHGNSIPEVVHIERYLPKAGYVEVRLTENAVQLEENLWQYDEYVLHVQGVTKEEVEANLSDWLITGRTLEVNENASEMADRKATMDVLGVATPAQAEAKHNAMVNAGAMLTDAQALEVIDLYDEWAVNKQVYAGNRIQFEGKLYKVLQDHTTQADWTPDVTPALYVEVGYGYREIKDGMLSTEAFAKGEIGWYQKKDNLWKSKLDANVYTPVTYPDGWEKYEEATS